MNAGVIKEIFVMKHIDGGLSAVKGFSAAGIHSGIKRAKKDLALIVSDTPASAAGVFTTNRVQAAPVIYDKQIITGRKPVRAIVINSGNANACTGKQGLIDAGKMAETGASAVGAASPEEVLVCSTGGIGVPLPIDIIEKGIKQAALQLGKSREAALDAAEAILTTDTFIKEIAVEIPASLKNIDKAADAGSSAITIAGIAKGSGMIHPNMATLLSFIVTDAAVDAETLQSLLGDSISSTYNMISVDGDTSTNDTVLVLANGASGTAPLQPGTAEFAEFKQAFDYVHGYLAKQIVRDGEGASKFVEAAVKGARTVKDARTLAKSIITSNLVKTALFGEDANWGRILCAMGYSGADFDPDSVDLTISSSGGSILLLKAGSPVPFDENLALTILKKKELVIAAVLQDGEAAASAWGCDLSYEYVKINGEYRT